MFTCDKCHQTGYVGSSFVYQDGQAVCLVCQSGVSSGSLPNEGYPIPVVTAVDHSTNARLNLDLTPIIKELQEIQQLLRSIDRRLW
jgi:hypothetical protein